jgi:hypothetical protein
MTKAEEKAGAGAVTTTHPRRPWPGAKARRRIAIGLRLLAGVGGGYGIAALSTMALSTSLPLPRAEAVLAASMASFAVFTAAIIWAFAARGVARAWLGLAIPAALLGLALLLSPGIGA